MVRDRSKNRDESEAVERRRDSDVAMRDRWSASYPLGMMRRFADEMDLMFEEIGFPRMAHLSRQMGMDFSPQVDIVEREGKLVVRADLPGLTKDDMTLDVTQDAIIIEGERKYEHEENQEGVYRSERSYGRFHRAVPLPEGVNADTATANFKDGVLEVTFDAPQSKKARRRIDIQSMETKPKPGQAA